MNRPLGFDFRMRHVVFQKGSGCPGAAETGRLLVLELLVQSLHVIRVSARSLAFHNHLAKSSRDTSVFRRSARPAFCISVEMKVG